MADSMKDRLATVFVRQPFVQADDPKEVSTVRTLKQMVVGQKIEYGRRAWVAREPASKVNAWLNFVTSGFVC